MLDRRGNKAEHPEWYLHQDLVITLRLKRESDVWLSLDEGYLEVAKLEREEDGSPRLLAMRASCLKDYLCARGIALYATSYGQRLEIVEETLSKFRTCADCRMRTACDRPCGQGA